MSFSILHSASRFHEHWRFVLQRLAFLAAFVVYLESASLVTRDEVAQILGSRYQFISVLFFSFPGSPGGWSLNILDHSIGKSLPTMSTRQANTNAPIALSLAFLKAMGAIADCSSQTVNRQSSSVLWWSYIFPISCSRGGAREGIPPRC